MMTTTLVQLTLSVLATGVHAGGIDSLFSPGQAMAMVNVPSHWNAKRDRHLGKREYYPAMSWVKGYCPVLDSSCQPSMVTKDIQDAECYKNVRVHHTTADPGLQSFAHFEINHSLDNNQYISYGTCHAYKCSLSAITSWEQNCDCATFSWEDSLLNKDDFGGIQEPQTGILECETSDGLERGGARGEWGCNHPPTAAKKQA